MPTYIHDIALIYGSEVQTTDVFVAWLLNSLSLVAAKHVYTHAAPVDGRRALIESALLDGLMPCDVVIPWEGRVQRLAQLSDQEMGAVICIDEKNAIGVAIAMSRSSGPIELKPEPKGLVVPFPSLDEPMLSAFSLGLASLAVRHGWIPRGLQPEELSGEQRELRAGNVNVVCREPTMRLRVPRPELRYHRAASVEDLLDGLERPAQNPAQRLTGTHAAVVIAPTGCMADAVSEAGYALKRHRTFSETFVYSNAPIEGKIAFLYPGPLNIYTGAGASLRALRKGTPLSEHPVAQVAWMQSQHEKILMRAGIHPDVYIGQSISPSWIHREKAVASLLKSTLVTQELDGELSAVRQGLALRGLVDEATTSLNWQAWLVLGPLEQTRAALESEPLIEISQIHTDHECVLVGPESAFDRVLVELLNSARMHATQLPYANAFHCSLAQGRVFMGQDLGAVDDLRPRILEAWEEGVRIFVDLGPRSWFAGWVARVLDDRPHLALSMDNPVQWGTRQMLRTLATLAAHGVAVDFDAVLSLMHRVEIPCVTLPAHDVQKDGVVLAIAHAVLEEQRLATRNHIDFIESQTRMFNAYLESQLKGIDDLEKISRLL